MDGLLVDSEVLWHRAEVEIFGSLDVPLAPQDARATKGMYVDEVVAYWYERFPWSAPAPEAVVARLLARVGELVESDGRLLPGALRAVDLAQRRGPIALASSTPIDLIERCLAHFALGDRFASVHSAQFEPYGKPHPGVFLTAAASLGVAPRECLVVEDSPAGVLAARAAQMSVLAVPAVEDRGDSTFLLADLVLSSLEELTETWLDERFV